MLALGPALLVERRASCQKALGQWMFYLM